MLLGLKLNRLGCKLLWCRHLFFLKKKTKQKKNPVHWQKKLQGQFILFKCSVFIGLCYHTYVTIHYVVDHLSTNLRKFARGIPEIYSVSEVTVTLNLDHQNRSIIDSQLMFVTFPRGVPEIPRLQEWDNRTDNPKHNASGYSEASKYD